MDQRFCIDNILHSTGHVSRKRLRFEEDPDYTEKSKHSGVFLGLFPFLFFWGFFLFWVFFPFFSIFSLFFHVVLVLYQSILKFVLDSFIENDEILRFVGNNVVHPPQAFRPINLCKPTFKMKQNYPMLFLPILKHFVIERTCQTVWTDEWKSRNTKVGFCFFP